MEREHGVPTLVAVVIGGDAAQVRALQQGAGSAAEVYAAPMGDAFAAQANASLRALVESYDGHDFTPKIVVLLDADTRLPRGWDEDLYAAFEAVRSRVLLPDDPTGMQRDIALLGRPIGVIAPASDQAHGGQRVELSAQQTQLGVDGYAVARRAAIGQVVSVADRVDVWCVAFSWHTLRVLLDSGDVLDPRLGDQRDRWLGDDLAQRLRGLGGLCGVAEGAYATRTTAVPRDRREPPPDVAPRLAYYRTYAVSAVRGITASIVLRPWVPNDLALTRAAIARAAQLSDVLAVLVACNPLVVVDTEEYAALKARNAIDARDDDLLRQCSGKGADHVGEAVQRWVSRACGEGSTVRRIVAACVSDGVVSDADLRTALDQLLDNVQANWVLALRQDEVVDDGVTRDYLDRLTAHPDPMVRAWDVALLAHWDSARIVRDDPPWGDGGKGTGGPHEVRLYRHGTAGRVAGGGAGGRAAVALWSTVDARRVAAVRLRQLGRVRPQDRAREHARRVRVVEMGGQLRALLEAGNAEALAFPPEPDALVSEDKLHAHTFSPHARCGLHVLVYERESPEDVARWLDDLHGVVDRAVLVWTGQWDDADKVSINDPTLYAVQHHTSPWYRTGPSREFTEVAHRFSATWVHHPLNDDIAAARNAGMDALQEIGGLTWALFVDPDEWLLDPAREGATLRRMCESTERWGWLWQVANYRAGPVPTLSESVRMSRLDAARSMRMNGRVHEGFHKAVDALNQRGVHPKYGYAPFVLQHRGMSDDVVLDAKLDRYERLLRLELADDPHNCGAWVSLAWHMANDGHHELGEECLRRAIACAGTAYLPFRELAYVHLRTARALMHECAARLAPSHAFAKTCGDLITALDKLAPLPQQIPRGAERGTPALLPEFPLDGLPAPGGGTLSP